MTELFFLLGTVSLPLYELAAFFKSKRKLQIYCAMRLNIWKALFIWKIISDIKYSTRRNTNKKLKMNMLADNFH